MRHNAVPSAVLLLALLLAAQEASGCTPTTTVLQFDGGYEVSMCYRTPDGEEGQAKAGLWASGESGLLWFFSRENAEVLVKVLDGCSHNGYRWIFVAPVTTLEFNLRVTGPADRRWEHSNRQGQTALTKSDTAAFRCSDQGNSVRLMYVSPANREFRADYSASMASAIVDAQDWYRGQMDGLTFSIDSLVPEWCRLPRNDDYYARGHAWEKVLEDVQSCAQVGYNSRFSWVLYVDVEERCDEQQELGAGGPGLIMVPRADLEGLTNPGIYYHCDEGPYNGTLGRWIGGLAHELGHSFGLPHPPGCDDGLSTCDEDALLWNGYQSYPDTYLREDEKAVLRRSPFFVTD